MKIKITRINMGVEWHGLCHHACSLKTRYKDCANCKIYARHGEYYLGMPPIYKTIEEGKAALKALRSKAKYWIDKRYPGIAIFLGLSFTKGEDACKKFVSRGVGRPKTTISGTYEYGHIHGWAVKLTKEAKLASFCKRLCKGVKRMKYFVAFGRGNYLLNYVWPQSMATSKYGKFPFEKLCPKKPNNWSVIKYDND